MPHRQHSRHGDVVDVMASGLCQWTRLPEPGDPSRQVQQPVWRHNNSSVTMCEAHAAYPVRRA
jgi:hypothetical protein